MNAKEGFYLDDKIEKTAEKVKYEPPWSVVAEYPEKLKKLYQRKTSMSNYSNVSILPESFSGTAVEFRGELHILGTADNAKSHYKYNGLKWVSVSTVPINVSTATGSIVYNDCIYIIGNSQSAVYKWNGSAWTSVSSLPNTYMIGTTVGVYDGCIHVMGAYSSTYYHYKYNGSTWTSVSTPPAYPNVGVGYKNKYHLFVGLTHYVWNGASWTQKNNMYNSQYGANSPQRAAIVGDKLFIMYSGNSSGQYYVYRWDEVNDHWDEDNYSNHQISGWSTIAYFFSFDDDIYIVYAKTITILYKMQCVRLLKYQNELHLLFSDYYKIPKYNAHYKLNGDSLVKVSDLPDSFMLGSVCVYGNEIHGFTVPCSATNHYKFLNGVWTKLASFNGGTQNRNQVVEHNNKIYYFCYNNVQTWDGNSMQVLTTDFRSGGEYFPIEIDGNLYLISNEKVYLWDDNQNNTIELHYFERQNGGYFDCPVIVYHKGEVHFFGDGYNPSNGYLNRRLHCKAKLDNSNTEKLPDLPVCTGDYSYNSIGRREVISMNDSLYMAGDTKLYRIAE